MKKAGVLPAFLMLLNLLEKVEARKIFEKAAEFTSFIAHFFGRGLL